METNTGIKNAFIIQGLNAFIWGIAYIVLPLLMLDKGISIESMGLIFAVLPLITQANRLIFGIISDYIGRKKFYWLNSMMNVVSLSVYYFARTPLGFLMGKITQGIRNAGLWSVNRAYFLDHSQKREQSLIKMRGIGNIFYAFGMLGAGFLAVKLLYGKTLLLLIFLSLFIFPNVKKLVDKDKREISILTVIDALRISNKSKKFKKFFAIYFIGGFFYGLVAGYIFPLFLRESGVGVEKIGLILGVQALLSGIAVYAFNSIGKGKDKLLIGGLLYSLFLIMLPFSNLALMPLLIALLGVFGGISSAGEETIFVEAINHNSLAGDIGLLMIGTHVGMSATQAISGLIISSYGFQPLFIAASILNVLFVVLAFQNMD